MLGTSNLVGFLPTANFAVARPFFEDLLGLELVAEDDFAMTFDANGTTLRLSLAEGFTPQPFTALGWWVDDVVGMAESLHDAGIEFQRYPGMQHDEQGLWSPPGSQVKVGWFLDPDGNTLSITGFVG